MGKLANLRIGIDTGGTFTDIVCVDGATGSCEVQGLCAVKGRWDLVNEAIQGALSGISLAQMRAASVPFAFRVPDPLPALSTFPAE